MGVNDVDVVGVSVWKGKKDIVFYTWLKNIALKQDATLTYLINEPA